VIENGQADEAPLPPRSLKEGETRNRFAFFGQINPFKGLDVVLEALTEMPKAERKNIVLEVHGANLEQQPQEFQDRIEKLRAPLIKQGVVQWVGPYQPDELRARMAAVDWVVVPSIWWENSPMVIQEAMVHGRPLLVSDIGGMREKVKDGVTGFHVPARSVLGWTRILQETSVKQTEEWEELRQNTARPIHHRSCASAHLQLIS